MQTITSYNGANAEQHAAQQASAAAAASTDSNQAQDPVTAFFHPYDDKKAPYGNNSLVYIDENCKRRFFFLLCGPEYRGPLVKGSRWVEFDAETFINSMKHFLNPDCLFTAEHTSSDDEDPLCMPNYKKVWPEGSIRCHDGAFYYNNVETASNPPHADWVGGSSNKAIMKALIDLSIS